jgi:hypothetical protein
MRFMGVWSLLMGGEGRKNKKKGPKSTNHTCFDLSVTLNARFVFNLHLQSPETASIIQI